MHTTKIGRTTFHYNADHSGDVVIVLTDPPEREALHDASITVPLEDVLAFALSRGRDNLVRLLESAVPLDVLRNLLAEGP
jgi:hypothetical protein